MSMEDALAYALGAAVRQPDPVLSSRETEIAELIAAGLTNREIGQRLYISERTVDGHVQRIFKKLDVRSRAEVSRRLAALKNEDAEPVDAV
jgi:DNA-binding NarL/FixJ family response regulator